jgi:hypothetical protein
LKEKIRGSNDYLNLPIVYPYEKDFSDNHNRSFKFFSTNSNSYEEKEFTFIPIQEQESYRRYLSLHRKKLFHGAWKIFHKAKHTLGLIQKA